MFFPKFPSTKLQDVNLDWLLKKIRALRGGTTNQVLAKASDADFDFKWVTGGGGGGTSDYNDLVNQPQINNVTLVGNLSASTLGLLDSAALDSYRTAAAQDAIDATKQAKITASGMLKGDGDGGVTAAGAGTDYLAPAALIPYRTAAAQDTIDAGKQAKITASGLLKGDGAGGVTAATAGTDYQPPISPYGNNPEMDGSASPGSDASYSRGDHVHPTDNSRAASAELSALENGLAIDIDGNKTNYISGASIGDYVFVKNSTISGIADGMYKAATAIPYNTAIDSTYLSAITGGTLNKIPKIEYGIKYPSSVPSGGYTDITFNFSTVFKSPPFVMLNLQSTSTSSALGSMSACVQSVTTTSCTCRLFNDSTSERNPDLYYIAVEI